MKKQFFIITAAVAAQVAFFSPYARGENYEIPIEKAIINTRSIISLPEASIDTQTDIVSVSFDCVGMYTLSVEDSSGKVVYTSVLPSDGMEYQYDLSGIGKGAFRLIIDGPGGVYEGFFNI